VASCQMDREMHMITVMSSPIIRALLALPHENRHFEQGTLLFAQGDAVRALFLLETGNVRLVRHLIDGFALTLHRAGTGAVLAEASLFSENYHCDAIAEQDTTVICIAKLAVRAAMRRDPDLMQNWAQFLTREVQSTRFRAEILALRTVAERLDAWLALRDWAMPGKGEWKTVATEIGVSAEALYRELARRRRVGNPD